jgi:ABC-2 type transport system ATP-binding protein
MFFVTATRLTKRFGNDNLALDNLNFHTKTNRLCFLGQNGSGKTTVLSIMAGLLTPSSGSLTIDGIEPYKDREKTLKTSTFVFEKPKLTYGMSVRDFIDFVKSTSDRSVDFEYIIERFRLKEFLDRRLFKLSSGQEQLIILASVFSRDTSRIIADEAFTHIDFFRVGNIINDMQNMNRDLIFSTHVPEEAELLADYIIILNNGRVVWNGTLDELFASDIYEVYVHRGEDIGMDYIWRYGDFCLVRTDLKILSELLEGGKIIGFRKSGVRRVYGQFNKYY